MTVLRPTLSEMEAEERTEIATRTKRKDLAHFSTSPLSQYSSWMVVREILSDLVVKPNWELQAWDCEHSVRTPLPSRQKKVGW